MYIMTHFLEQVVRSMVRHAPTVLRPTSCTAWVQVPAVP